jgi:hypothetical protein
MESFSTAEQMAAQIDAVADSVLPTGSTAPGFSVGPRLGEEILVTLNGIAGPLQAMQYLSYYYDSPADLPKSLQNVKEVSAKADVVMQKLEQEFSNIGTPDPNLRDEEVALTALEAAREKDADAQKNALYYDVFRLQLIGSLPERTAEAATLIEKLEHTPGFAPWMTNEAKMVNYELTENYAALMELSEARLQLNKEDSYAIEAQVKSLYLTDKQSAAYEKAEAFEKSLKDPDTARLLKADLLMRDKKYNDALKLLDTIIKAQGSGTLAAISLKIIVYALQNKPEDALYLAMETYDTWEGNFDISYAYAALVAAITTKDDAFYETIAQGMGAVPQSLRDLKDGKTTVAGIYTTGWGAVQ